MLFYYLFLTLLGLAVGSFLGMLTFRLPKNIALSGRSFCTSCKKKISWFDNIPILSYLWLRTKCRLCKSRISFRYPFIEALTVAVFLLTGYLARSLNPGHGIAYFLKQNLGILFLPFLLLLVVTFLTLLVTDFESEILPDEILLPLAVVVLLVLVGLPSPALLNHLLVGFLVFTFFLALYLLTRGRGMGFGDVKMSAILGSLLGWPGVLVWLFLAFLSGAVSGVLLILGRRARFGKPIPFGPYLLVSAYAAFFYGEMIWEIWGIGGI